MTAAATRVPRERLTLKDTTDLLGHLNQWIEDHVDELELNGGALPDDLAALLDDVVASQRDRADAIAFKLDEFQGYATTAKATKDRSARREKVWNNTMAAMKVYVLGQLERLGVDRIRGVTATLRRQINSAPSVECSLMPAELLQAADYDPDFDDGDAPAAFPLMRFLSIERVAVLDRKALAKAYAERREQLEAEAAVQYAGRNDIPAAQMDLIETALAGEPTDEPLILAVDETLSLLRETYVAGQLAIEFPGVTVARGSHLRID